MRIWIKISPDTIQGCSKVKRVRDNRVFNRVNGHQFTDGRETVTITEIKENPQGFVVRPRGRR